MMLNPSKCDANLFFKQISFAIVPLNKATVTIIMLSVILIFYITRELPHLDWNHHCKSRSVA